MTGNLYKQGELRIVRYAMISPYEPEAYIVEESKTSKRINRELMMEEDALLLMRELGSPYKGSRYGKNWTEQLIDDAMAPSREIIQKYIYQVTEPLRRETVSLLREAIKPVEWR